MNTSIATSCLLLFLVGCSTETPRPDVTEPRSIRHKKRSAPVDIAIDRLGTGHATLRITCRRRSKDVTVHVYGLAGLKILTPGYPIKGQSFEAGDSHLIQVGFMPATDRNGSIALGIRGEFGGIPGHKTTTIAVGPLNGAGAVGVEPNPAVHVDSTGQRVHVTPAERR